MPLSLQHRHAVLLADRTRDVRTITTVVTEVLVANPETTPLDIETALRAAAGQAYLVANSTTAGFEIVPGMPAWRAALADAGVPVEQNWAALSTVQSVDQRMRLGMRCRLSPTADMPSHTSGAAMTSVGPVAGLKGGDTGALIKALSHAMRGKLLDFRGGPSGGK